MPEANDVALGEQNGWFAENFVSNEVGTFEFLPYIRNLTGCVVGVGLDQGLDLYANSRATHAVVIDFVPSTSLLTRTLLEVGMYHRTTFQRNPSPEEYVEYFEPKNINQVRRIMTRVLPIRDIEKIMKLIETGFEIFPNSGDRRSLAYYMRFKNSLKDNDDRVYSWMGVQENIDRVLQAYNDGNIYVLRGDVTNVPFMHRVGDLIQSFGVDATVLYLSNILNYYAEDDYTGEDPLVSRAIITCIKSLNISKDGVILRTVKGVVGGGYQLPEAIKSDKAMEEFYEGWGWHYNIQRYKDWEAKIGFDPRYLHVGWRQDIQDKVKRKKISKKGVSVLGF